MHFAPLCTLGLGNEHTTPKFSNLREFNSNNKKNVHFAPLIFNLYKKRKKCFGKEKVIEKYRRQLFRQLYCTLWKFQNYNSVLIVCTLD